MLTKKQILYLKINEFFFSKEVGTGMLLKNFFFLVQCLLCIVAGARVGAGEKNTRSRSRSKTDRLHNTGSGSTGIIKNACMLQLDVSSLQCCGAVAGWSWTF